MFKYSILTFFKMDKADILYGIQERLIGDLGDVVARVDHQYRLQLHNG